MMCQDLTFENAFPNDATWPKPTQSTVKNVARKLEFKDMVTWVCEVSGYAEALVNVICSIVF